MLKVQVIQSSKTAVKISDGTNTRVVPRDIFDEKIKSREVEVVNVRIKCVRKVRNKNNIIVAYVITDDTGKIMEVKPKDLKEAIRDYKVSCVNLSLTVDNKLIDTEEVVQAPVTEKVRTQVEVKPQVEEKAVQKNIENRAEDKPQKVNETVNDSIKEAYRLIESLKTHADYNKSLVSKIEGTIKKSNRITDRQLYFIRKQHDEWFGTNLVEAAKRASNNQSVGDYYDKSIKIANILKNKSDYDWDNSFPKKIYIGITKYKKASEKQYEVFDREAKKLGINIDDYDDNGKLKQVANSSTTINDTVPASNIAQPKGENLGNSNDEGLKQVKRELTSLVNIEKMAKKLTGVSYYKPIASMGIISEDEIVYEKMSNGQLFAVGLKKDVESTELIIPDTVVINGVVTPVSGIRSGAFRAAKIRSIVIGANVHDIGQDAFADCTSLVKADLGNGKHTFIAARLFNNCVNLEEVNVGNNLLRIHEYAFNNCIRLKQISIPNDIEVAKHAFSNCFMLEQINGSPKTIMESAFSNCIRLKIFDFSHTQSIGTQSFRNCGFESIDLSGNIFSIGNKAFADCIILRDITIEEGVEKLGEYCFAKSTKSFEVSNVWAQVAPIHELEKYLVKAVIDTPKSIDKVGTDTFRHAECVKVFAGSACESACIAFNTAHVIKDKIDTSNSTRTRIKAGVLGKNPCEALYTKLTTQQDGTGNLTPFNMQTGKLVLAELNKNTLSTLQLAEIGEAEVKEPNIMFKAAVSYLQDIADIFTMPLSDRILRLQQTFYKESEEIYNDGYNRIVLVTYTIMDTLEEGSFIIVLNGNKLILCVDCNMLTNITVGTGEDNIDIPVRNYVHTGDRLGNSSSIAGANTHIKLDDGSEVNVGKEVLKHIILNGIKVNRTKTDYAIYVPSQGVVVKLHDGRTFTTVDGKKVISKDTEDCLNVTGILDYQDFIEEIKSSSKGTKENLAFFTKLSELTKEDVEERISQIGVIAEEKQAQLFNISKAIVEQAKKIGITGKALRTITPDAITPEIFMELSRSYWLIEKDMDWIDTAGRKSLNRTHEYNIGKYKVCEYKSNQVVKFSNAYMSGTKGAYVFELKLNNRVVSLYTSRFSLGEIVNLAVQLTTIPSHGMETVDEYVANTPVLMTNAYKIDKVDPNLFVKFYDVVYCKDGWTLRKFMGVSTQFGCNGAMFSISMYKPTGIMYLTITTYVEDKVRSTESDKRVAVQNKRATLPIFPIGDMDRALVVANTTNSNNKKANVLNELMALSVYMICNEDVNRFSQMLRYCDGLEGYTDVPNRYMKARELIIAGVNEVDKYRKLLDDRIIYMIGTVHKGVLQREGDNYSIEYAPEEDISDDEIYDEEVENMISSIEDIDENDNDNEDDGFNLEDLGFSLDEDE